MIDYIKENEEMTSNQLLLKLVSELANKCETLEEFKLALAKIMSI